MMKNLISMWIIVLLFTIVSARPQLNRDIYDQNIQPSGQSTTPVAIISQYDVNSPDGSFNSSYEASNGIKVVNSGFYKRIKIPRYEDINGKVIEEHEEDILVQTGSYSYFDPDGNIITLTYLADENGFQPSGSHIPTVAPPTNQLYANLTNQRLIQERPIQQSNQNYQERQIQQSNPNYQDRPIQQTNPNYQDRPIQQTNPNYQDRPIQQQRPGFIQDRPIQG